MADVIRLLPNDFMKPCLFERTSAILKPPILIGGKANLIHHISLLFRTSRQKKVDADGPSVGVISKSPLHSVF